jgi:hypothetical protein
MEGIRNNSPYILTHSEFRDELRELYEMLDRSFPQDREVPAGRGRFEEQRRSVLERLRRLPAKD